jgi:hypothetical protein
MPKAKKKKTVGITRPKRRRNVMLRALPRKDGVRIASRKAAALRETIYLLSSPANAKELLSAIAEADAGKFIEGELIDE